MTLSDVLVQVRYLIQDSKSPERYSDGLLTGFANQALKRIAILRPDLFSYMGQVSCVADSVIQRLPLDSIRLIEVHSVKGGNSVHETNKEILDQSIPDWTNEPAGNAINFMRHIRNPNIFFIYPKAPEDQILVTEYAQTPTDYTKDQLVDLLSDVYLPVVVDATVFLVESMDNEHVLSNRANLFYSSFTGALGVAVKSRELTDKELSGVSKEGAV